VIKRKLWLTVVWLSAFVLALAAVEAHIHVRFKGALLLLPDDRLNCMKPLITFYSVYLVGIIGSWYVSPFRPNAKPGSETIRFGLAVACAALLNLIVLVLTAQCLVLAAPQTHDVVKEVNGAVTLGGWMSFLVAPANLYYFGLKRSAAPGGA
jgi:hypothetical protein